MGLLDRMARKLGVEVADNIRKNEGESFVLAPDPSLTWALCGGFAKNRLNVLAGDSGSGKTTLSVLMMAVLLAENPDAIAVIIDSEYFYHNRPERIERLKLMGVDTSRVLIKSTNDPNTAFKFLADVEETMKSGDKICCLLFDSLGGMLHSGKLEQIASGEAEKAGNAYGGDAKLIASNVRLMVRMAAENNCTIFAVQHAMDDISNPMSKKKIVKGGQVLRLLSDTITLFSSSNARDSKIDVKGDTADSKSIAYVGKTIRAKVDKCREGVEGRSATFALNFENGSVFKPEVSLFDIASQLGVVYHPEGRGMTSWGIRLPDGEEFVCVGKPKMQEKLKDKEVMQHILKQCLESKNMANTNVENDIILGEESC